MTLLNPGFLPVPKDGKIDTLKFIEACEKIPSFFDMLGPTVFAPVKIDVEGNIKKIKTRYLQKPDCFATLYDIIEKEKQEKDKELKVKDGNGIATNALMWLKRGLLFILEFMERFLKNDYGENLENLKPCVKNAYATSLEPFHGWMVKNVVKLAINACPSRSTFIKTLATEENVSQDEALHLASQFVVNFRENVDNLYELYRKMDAETIAKV